MPKTQATIIEFGEIDCDITTQEVEITRGDDAQMIKDLNELNGQGENGSWHHVGIAHTPRTTIVEWKSERGHYSGTTICWSR